MKKTLITGDRPSGKLHIGHYFGALKSRVEMQNEYETFILIADVQALTDNFLTPDKIKQSIIDLTLDYLSIGIDPSVSHIYIQSLIPEISDLTIYLSNLVTVSRLYRNPTTKHEVSQKKNLFGDEGAGITYGFLGYPVSQAADILVMDGDVVPVGDDQIPHVEQTREIARKFNQVYGDTFKEPVAVLSKNPRIKGLDGNDKMSKSLNNAIYLSDSEEEVNKKIMRAVTDTNKIKIDDKADPNKCMVYAYHKLFSNSNLNSVDNECRNGLRGCVSCKKELCSVMNDYLKPIREKRAYYEKRPEFIEEVLKEGTKHAKARAEATMKKVKKNMKIDYFN